MFKNNNKTNKNNTKLKNKTSVYDKKQKSKFKQWPITTIYWFCTSRLEDTGKSRREFSKRLSAKTWPKQTPQEKFGELAFVDIPVCTNVKTSTCMAFVRFKGTRVHLDAAEKFNGIYVTERNYTAKNGKNS